MARKSQTPPKVEPFLNTNTNLHKSYPLTMPQHDNQTGKAKDLFPMVMHQAPSEVVVLGPVQTSQMASLRVLWPVQTSQMGLLRVQLGTWVSQILATPNGLKEVLAVCQQIAFTGPRQMPPHWRVWNPMFFLQMALNQDGEALTEVTEADRAMGREQTTLPCSQWWQVVLVLSKVIPTLVRWNVFQHRIREFERLEAALHSNNLLCERFSNVQIWF